MRNIKLLISFDGTDFCGWQRQQKLPTIQGIIEEKLAVICNEPVVLHGAGRTDSGVHALAMVANFTTASAIACHGLQKGLNSLLPPAIRIHHVVDVDSGFHARKSALAKTYCYYFSTAAMVPATSRLYVTSLPGPFALPQVQKCLALLRGRHDFSSFEATGSRDRSRTTGRGAVRTLFEATLRGQGDPDLYKLVLRGDGFLRKMVRNIVGTLFEVGQGRMSVSRFQEVIAARDRNQAGPTASACGLFLTHIEYSDEER
ncbi:MAG: tRNA pseudouridine(38-40) synthase TruA [Desulfobulbaceae bacterium]|nr:MAG: tRNA pseudouridine(38-40) synthase TruA [Desulfobulbaceae bacterium]